MKLIFSKPRRRPALADRARLIRALRRALVLTHLPEHDSGCVDGPSELHVILVGSERMSTLNERHLGHSGPTDVLAFDLRDDLAGDVGSCVFGEIYICLDVAVDASREYGTELGEEVVLYAVHGMLHLRGFEDHTSDDRSVMDREQSRIVDMLREKPGLRGIFTVS